MRDRRKRRLGGEERAVMLHGGAHCASRAEGTHAAWRDVAHSARRRPPADLSDMRAHPLGAPPSRGALMSSRLDHGTRE